MSICGSVPNLSAQISASAPTWLSDGHPDLDIYQPDLVPIFPQLSPSSCRFVPLSLHILQGHMGCAGACLSVTSAQALRKPCRLCPLLDSSPWGLSRGPQHCPSSQAPCWPCLPPGCSPGSGPDDLWEDFKLTVSFFALNTPVPSDLIRKTLRASVARQTRDKVSSAAQPSDLPAASVTQDPPEKGLRPSSCQASPRDPAGQGGHTGSPQAPAQGYSQGCGPVSARDVATSEDTGVTSSSS